MMYLFYFTPLPLVYLHILSNITFCASSFIATVVPKDLVSPKIEFQTWRVYFTPSTLN